jgi:hypothetical protein
MIKVVCKNNHKDVIDDEDDYELSIHKNIIEQYKGGGDHLIIDKVYEVYNIEVLDFNAPKEEYYHIENESGQSFWYSSNRFKTISDNRDDKLKELGI